MKRLACVLLATVLAAGVSLLSACGEQENPLGGDAQTTETQTAPLPSVPSEEEVGKQEPEEQPEVTEPEEQPEEQISPLALLESVSLETAFGDTAEPSWSYALQIAGALSAEYSFRWTSEISGREKFYAGLAAEASISDTLGVRASDANPLGFDLFGGGAAGLAFTYTGPGSDSEPVEKNFEAGIRHDGDLVWYAREGEAEKNIDISTISEYLSEAAQLEVYAGIMEAVETIPAELEKGLSLRVGVEKLIDLGFTVEIDDTAGLTVRIVAEKGFFTDLLNDALEEFLPADWLKYIPRADFRYTSTDFDITIAFDENGLFKEYTVKNDVQLGISLEVRGLFLCESTMGTGGTFSVTAYSGEVPGFGAEEGGSESGDIEQGGGSEEGGSDSSDGSEESGDSSESGDGEQSGGSEESDNGSEENGSEESDNGSEENGSEESDDTTL